MLVQEVALQETPDWSQLRDDKSVILSVTRSGSMFSTIR